MNHVFCTDLSREAGDPLPGSGAHAERNLLISWPRARWQRNLRHASDMAPDLVAQLDALAASGRRVNLIHRRDQPAEVHEVILMPERRRLQLDRSALLAFVEALAAGEDLERWPSTPQHHDLVLCCTHGKKDKCCARYGYRSYKALARAVEEHRLPFDVWESSHLGGCRFAASIILLSPVRKYGRIEPDQALPMLQAEAQGQRFLPGYRGASHLTPAQQCAEVAALQWLARDSALPCVELALVEDNALDPQEMPGQHTYNDSHNAQQYRRQIWRWRQPGEGDGRGNVGEASGELVVHCHTLTLERIDMCSDIEKGPSPSQVWRAASIQSIDAGYRQYS
ncbi:sucrase ferredoxin [Halomonas sp. DN3]|uniref:sucrase ferredoxin n=1 Tax=Halomonas sp. DN3 TaxID=2953657 RepID=UPI0020A0025B|nr:sucrase ferredoxin [Halomonas sp. DN3]USZ48855.1 sucrase ferredoxin [Halomonas sp. DN3]